MNRNPANPIIVKTSYIVSKFQNISSTLGSQPKLFDKDMAPNQGFLILKNYGGGEVDSLHSPSLHFLCILER